MDTIGRVLGVAVVMGSGVTAGVLLGVTFSVVPVFLSLPPGRYVETHKLAGQYYDRVMPAIVLTSTAAAAWVAVLTRPVPARVLFAAGAALLLGVSTVSHLGNVPINRRVKALAPGTVPAGWADPRPRWRALNLVRTWLAVLALAVNGVAIALIR